MNPPEIKIISVTNSEEHVGTIEQYNTNEAPTDHANIADNDDIVSQSDVET